MNQDLAIVRELARQWAEVTQLPRQAETRRLWKQLNMLTPERPMVNIDQIPWHELNVNDELTLRCENDMYRAVEGELRRRLYQWKHMPCDMMIDDFMRIPVALHDWGYSLRPQTTLLQFDDLNTNAFSQHYAELLHTPEDVEKIDAMDAYIDDREQAMWDGVFHEIFDGILPLKRGGIEMVSAALWDYINQIHDIQTSLMELIDDPDFVHHLLGRVRDATMKMIDQAETLGLLIEQPSMVHCTGAYYDWKLAPHEPGKLVNAKNSWIFGMSQIFASVGPDMHEEFEYPYLEPLFRRFGNVYYGCCEPLHTKVDMIRKYSNVRKISMSPWADVDVGAEQIHGDYVFSNKPNPAFLAKTSLDEDEIRKSLQHTYDACKRNNTPLEFIMKDISTVCYEPQRLWRWAEIAMEIAKQDC